MCIDVDDTIGPEDKIPLVDRRGFLRGVAATAAVATVGGPAALATPALAAEGGKKAKDSVPLDQISIQLFTLRDQLAATSRARSPRSMRSATHGSSTRVLSAGPPRSSRRCWMPTRYGQHPATSSSRSRSTRPLGALAGRRQHPGVDLHRASFLRDQLRHRRGDSHNRAVGGVRTRHEPGRPDGPGRRAAAWLPQPQLGVLPADRRPVADRIRRPDGRDRSGPRAPGAGPVLGHSGRARPGGHHRAERRPDPAVPRQGHEPGRRFTTPAKGSSTL